MVEYSWDGGVEKSRLEVSCVVIVQSCCMAEVE